MHAVFNQGMLKYIYIVIEMAVKIMKKKNEYRKMLLRKKKKG